MLWIVLILFSAAALGLYDVAKKHAVHANAVMPVLFWGTVAGTAGVILAQILSGHWLAAVSVSGKVWSLLLIKSAVVAASWVCAYYAMRALPISIAAPVRSSQPAWTVVGALLFFAERPGRWQWLGIGTTLVGYWVFSLIGRREGIEFRRHSGIGLILLATILGAASGLYDKYLLQPMRLTPQMVQIWFQINLCILIGGVWLFQQRSGLARTAFTWRWSIPLIGLLLATSDFLYFTALHEPEAMISILSPIRRSNCVISFLVGGMLFGDKNRRAKAVGVMLILAGVVLLCITAR